MKECGILTEKPYPKCSEKPRSNMESQDAVNLHMALTRKDDAICKNCGQKITRFTLPQPQHPENEHETWYHLCVDPRGLRHFILHTANDPKPGEKTCYEPEPQCGEIK